ncbi:FAD/NAD(P)-binding protein [Burkholderia sp. LMG 21824]|uniref:FAD/NAD(P)-binding protein n=1 Tax=Burkholderia sp. LMG 21824 TaxID=3158172 RepID=UPI003C2D7F8B
MKPSRQIAIVGAGPMGTYALERLAAHLSTLTFDCTIKVLVFERGGEFGGGSTHSPSQVPTSYLNRVASQISFAADESVTHAGPLLRSTLRPTFYEWVRSMFEATGDPRFDLVPSDVPQRYLHGMALRDAFHRYAKILQSYPNTFIEMITAEVIDLQSLGSDGYRITASACGTSSTYAADFVLLTTGHARSTPSPDSKEKVLATYAASAGHSAHYIDYPYPLKERLNEATVPPGAPTALMGMGLTAIDTIMHLTEGRGGRFQPRSPNDPIGVPQYIPSGREPRIVVASPSGMFTSCRPYNEKALDGTGVSHVKLEHKGQFLTEMTIRGQRDRWGRLTRLPHGEVRQLDFERHIFPIIVLEMAYVYYRSLVGSAFAEDFKAVSQANFADYLTKENSAPVDAVIDVLLQSGQSAFDQLNLPEEMRKRKFNWRRQFWPLDEADAQTPERWRRATLRYLREDLAQAQRGNLSDPVKAASDGVWRDLRSILSQILDFGGLSAGSHRQFTSLYFRLYTRMSNGTGVEPMSKLLALVEAGVVDVSAGPHAEVVPDSEQGGFMVRGKATGAAIPVQLAIEGRGHSFNALQDESPLYRNLLRCGIVRHWRNPGIIGEPDFIPGALDVCSGFHPLDAQGQPQTRLTIFGAPVEGLRYFQLSAARPGSNSAILGHTARWAQDLVEQLSQDLRSTEQMKDDVSS